MPAGLVAVGERVDVLHAPRWGRGLPASTPASTPLGKRRARRAADQQLSSLPAAQPGAFRISRVGVSRMSFWITGEAQADDAATALTARAPRRSNRSPAGADGFGLNGRASA
jgi:hypothetical protein